MHTSDLLCRSRRNANNQEMEKRIMASAQTRASKKYQEKVGLISKSYKIKKELADQFAEKCDQNGIAASRQLSIMMQEYIDTH